MTSHKALRTGASVALAALLAGCGGSGLRAQRAPTTSTSTVTAQPVASTTTTTPDLAGVKQELDDAGTALPGADGAIGQTDPNAARAQEGSTP
jgi:hypothetical protein